MPEFLLELFSEEIPARMQPGAAADLERLVRARLDEARLPVSAARTFVTPRRLTLVMEGLPERQADVTEERKGPFVGAPQKAIDGFLASAGLSSPDGLERRAVGKTEYYYLVRTIPGRPTRELLADVVAAVIRTFPWPKSMRWGAAPLRWVRPLQSILCMFDRAVVDVDLAAHHLRARDITHGHRFLAPDPIRVESFEDYRAELRAAYVLIDREERKRHIIERANELAAAEGLRVVDDAALLDEVCGLVEWPVPLIGSIDEQYMSVPREVLATTMRANQKYFTTERADGSLAPRFIVVANVHAEDGGTAIVAGNERVLRARLSDARFFWDHDLQVRLADRVPRLNELVFHAQLGTLEDKAARLERLAGEYARYSGARALEAQRAGLLAKADLVSGMVGEFPELQGVMGRYYALHDGEADAVAWAIEEHYAPLGPSDRCPTAPVSVAAALADKIDTLVGFFAIDEKPTGSKDPYALRRAALGVIRLILENRLRIPLLEAFRAAADAYARQQPALRERMNAFDGRELLAFFADRLKTQQRERGTPHDLISAVFSLGDEDDLVRLLARVEALRVFLDAPDGANLLTAYKRASNIVGREERKDNTQYGGEVDPALFAQEQERDLHGRLGAAIATIAREVAEERFERAMAALAEMRPAVDAFFDDVTVNADDAALRRNRLRLLSGIRSALGTVADFAKIER